jgi:hypothetical protein
MEFSIKERYTLKLSWDKVNYEQPGVCNLNNAKFSGPALAIASKINPNDKINIDFYKQYYLIAQNVYVATLSWEEVVYNKDKSVTLKNAKLTHDTELNRVPKLSNGDFILIDTQNHESHVHAFNFVYTSYVVNETGQLYDFRG